MSILVDKNTRVITQGITGATGLFHAQGARDYGTQIRITSYNVCYTKLLRIRSTKSPARARRNRATPSPRRNQR